MGRHWVANRPSPARYDQTPLISKNSTQMPTICVRPLLPTATIGALRSDRLLCLSPPGPARRPLPQDPSQAGPDPGASCQWEPVAAVQSMGGLPRGEEELPRAARWRLRLCRMRGSSRFRGPTWRAGWGGYWCENWLGKRLGRRQYNCKAQFYLKRIVIPLVCEECKSDCYQHSWLRLLDF